jgi:hypothetical protein
MQYKNNRAVTNKYDGKLGKNFSLALGITVPNPDPEDLASYYLSGIRTFRQQGRFSIYIKNLFAS